MEERKDVQCRRCENACRLVLVHDGERITDVLKRPLSAGSPSAPSVMRATCGRAASLKGKPVDGVESRLAMGARDGRLPLGFSIGVH